METKDQPKIVDQTSDLHDSTTANDAGTQESPQASEKLETVVEAKAKTEQTTEEVKQTESPVIEEKEIELKETEAQVKDSSKELENPDTEVKEKEVEKYDSSKEDTPETTVTESKELESKETESIEEDFSEMEMDQLVNRLVDLINEAEDILLIKDKVAAIKGNYIRRIKAHKQEVYDKFIEDGGDENEYKSVELPFENNYKEAFKIYKEKRTILLKKLEAEKESNLVKKENLLEQLRTMIKSEESLKKTYDEFKKLQEQWREIGMIPQAKVKNLWENYHFLVDQFFDKVKISHELRDLDLRKNLEAKIKLSEKVEELLLEKSINKSFTILQELHDKWREVGSVPMEKKDEIWERFKAATDKINQRRHEYYEKLHEEQQNNLILKTALCEKMDELHSIERGSVKEWNEELIKR